MQEHEMTFEIVGYTPILMHNAEKLLGGGGVAKKAAERIPKPHDEAQNGLYVMPNGQLYIPLIAFFRCAIKAGGKLRAGKRTLGQILAGSILTDEGVCPLVDPGTDNPITAADIQQWPIVEAGSFYENLPDKFIDRRRAVVQRQGIKRCRARIQYWKTYVTFRVDPRVMDTHEQLLECLEDGGRFVGVLDYRPEKGGPFGRFVPRYVDAGATASPKKGRKAK